MLRLIRSPLYFALGIAVFLLACIALSYKCIYGFATLGIASLPFFIKALAITPHRRNKLCDEAQTKVSD